MNRLLRGVPLRIRIVVAVVLLVTVGLAASGVAATTALHSYLLQRVDSQLLGTQIPPNACVGFGGGPDGGPPRDRFQSQPYVEEFDGDGARMCTQPAGSTDAVPDLTAASASVDAHGRPRPVTVDSVGSGPSWRAVVRTYPDGDVRVVAMPLSDVNHTIGRLVALEATIGGIVLLLLAVAGYFVIRRSLKPLIDVEHTAVAIAGGDLSQRVPDLDPRTEIGRLTSALNAMLGQIETAFARQRESEQQARASEDRMRRFVADASHELRTPLTSIRGFAELYRQGAVAEADDVARVMRRVEDEAQRMGLLVEDLLLLARLDQERPLAIGPVDLLSVVADAVHDAQAVAPDRAITLDVGADPPVVDGDDARLRQVVHNLLSNALRHTPAGSPVEVRLHRDGDTAVIDVVDHGSGLPADAQARVFERFYRVDSARARDAGGAGLGLSIVAALVAAHRGAVGVGETPGGGATFRVRLPAVHSNLADDGQRRLSEPAQPGD